MKRKLLSVFLTLCLAFSLLPTAALAEGPKVAKVGDAEYTTLADALANAADGATVTLLENVVEDVVINKSITLDLGGKTLTNTGAGKATLTVAAGATATVKNGSIVGGTGHYNIAVGTKAVPGGNLTLEGVTATAGNNGSSMIDNWGTLTITSGTYTGGLNVVKSEEGSTLNINGGKFTLDYATSGYTGVIFAYGTTTISGGEFIQSLTTTGRWNHPQVILAGVEEGYTSSVKVTGGSFTNKMSGEGIFRGVGKGTSDNFKVSGGTFNKSVSEGYCADGFIPTKNADGTYGVKEGKYVAAVGSKKYETLADAIRLAAKGTIVTLLDDVTLDAAVKVPAGKTVTLDLNGKALSTSENAADNTKHYYAIDNYGTFTLQDSSTEQSGEIRARGIENFGGGKMVIKSGKIVAVDANGGAAIWNLADLTIEGGTFVTEHVGASGDTYGPGCVYNNAGTLTINGGTFTSANKRTYAVVSKSGAVTIEPAAGKNVEISGAHGGLGIDGGTATIKGGSYASSEYYGLYVSNDAGTAEVTVTGGTFTGKEYSAFIGSDGASSVNSTLKIEGGTFNNPIHAQDNTVKGAIQVSGGTFTSAVLPEYCANGFIPTKNADNTYGVKEGTYVAEVNGTKYESLAEAIKKAPRNATVTLLADTRENVTIDKAMTLDLNGHILNGGAEKAKPALTITARPVTIKDSSEGHTGTIMREDTAENSGVSSHYVIDVQGSGWLTFESGNVKNNSGNIAGKGASLVRVGDDSVAKFPGLNIKGGTFTQDNFIVIKVDRGDLFLNGGMLSSANSYAVENWLRATIKGGTVNGAVSSWTYSDGSNSTLTISGGIVNGNVEAVSYDGSAGKKASVSITGGTVNGALGTYIYSNGPTATEDTSKATIGITGGTFAQNPTKYVIEDSAITANADGTFGVAKAYLAKVGDTSYYTMDDAFKAQTASGEAIELLRDYTTGSTFSSGSVARVVDLNGHTWTCTGTDANSAAFEINNPNASLTVKNGKIFSSQLVGLIPSAMGGTIKYDNSSLTFEDVVMTTSATSGIETNGNNTNDSVTLKNSTLNVPNGFGIYFPSSGTLTIDNSTINAKTMGVQVCAGSLSINAGSAITVSGDPVEKTENDGAIQDGAAISIVNRDGYKGLGKIEVTGGTFTSATAPAIRAYHWEYPNATDWTDAGTKVNISGGTFSSIPDNMSTLCAAGYIPFKNADGTYGVTRPSSGSSGSYDPTYSVSTPSKTEHGSVTVSPKSASKGDTVTVTVKPDSGYVLETLTVTDKNGNELTLKDKGNGKYTFTMPAGKVEVKATFMEDNSMLNFFYDVPNNAYFYEAVKWAVKNGITTGVGNDLFAPEQPCTRAQIVTFLWRAAGSPEPKGAASGMTDVVSGSYYEKAVAWAIENGITTGTTTSTFSPDATCTRAQAVTFLARALNAKAASAAEFSDVPTDSYFADAVAWAAANGVTEGIGGGLFGSDNDCTRGQIVTFLYRAYNK